MNYSVRYSLFFPTHGNSGGIERFSDYAQAKNRADEILSFLPVVTRIFVGVYGPELKKIWSYELDKEKKS